MPPKNKPTGPTIKQNDEIHSQDEAVAESCHRAEIIMSLCNKGDVSTFFRQKPFIVVDKIYRSMFDWRPWRQAVTEQLCKIKFVDLLADACAYCVSPDAKVPQGYAAYAIAIVYGLVCSATDCSQEACRIMIAKEIIPVLIKNIEPQENFQEEDKKSALLSINMSIIHNIAKLPESKEKYEAVNASEVIKPYFANPSEKIQISALSAVACILGDSSASAALIDNNAIIPKLVKCLESALNHVESQTENTYLGFSAEELVESLAFLAVNDDNKLKIAESGALPLLVKMLRSSDTVEQGRAVDCLWALSFNENIRKEILALEDCPKLLEEISNTSPDSSLKLKANRAFDYIKIGKEGLAGEKNVGVDSKKVAADAENGHIFISYSWKHQEMARTIRQLLLDKGYRVWMDIDNMHSNTLEAMAQGVENAFLVLILYSEYYKQSNMCRTEAEYVYRLGKPFIPINMQYRYFPTGWLGIILGARLYVDFSLHKHPLDEVIRRLFQEINNMLLKQQSGNGNATEVEVEIKPRKAIELGHAPGHEEQTAVCQCCKMMEKLVTEIVSNNEQFSPTQPTAVENRIREWTPDKVKVWLRNEGLNHVSLPDFDGPALLGLYDMKQSASHFYYSSILKLVDDSFADCIRVTAALEKLVTHV